MTPEQMIAARAEFEHQHNGRNLKRHPMRGTYYSAPIAALWNQHLRTIKWLDSTETAREPRGTQDLLECERRDAQTLVTLLRKERERFEFLHSPNKDENGWEWGVARIRVTLDGHVDYLWGISDHSDIDAILASQPSAQPEGNKR